METIFEQIFNRILKEAMDAGLVDLETVFGDGTYVKANANKRKHTDAEIEITKKCFEDSLLEEINQERALDGKKRISLIKQNRTGF